MSSVKTDADDIRRRMAEIRSRLHQDVRGVVRDASQATDWTAYVKNRPWTAIGVAFAAGFLLVPRKNRPTTVVVAPSAKPREIQVTAPSEAPRGFRPLRFLLAAVGPVALRAAQSYALSAVESYLTAGPAGPGAGTGGGGPSSSPPRPEGRRLAPRDQPRS